MSHLRRISTRRLAALIAGALALLAVGAGIAIGASSGGPTPEPKPLAQAIHDALGGSRAAEGVSARISFTNEMVDGSGITRGTDPLIAGASGRLWVAKNGDLRLELQSEGGGGDAQILVRGDRFSIYHAAANTVYEGTLPDEPRRADRSEEPWPPGVAAIERVLGRIARSADLSSAVPSNVAGREAYTVRVAPQRHGGLLGALELAWDAANGAPLKVAVYAKDRNDPVLALEATDVSFGPVSGDVFDVAAPADAKVVTLTPPKDGASRGGARTRPVTGVAAVSARLSFPLRAPATLAGRERTGVALIEGHDGDPDGAIVTYGDGLDGIAVLQAPATAETPKAGERSGTVLPTTDLGGGVTATELRTPLGTALTFTRDGVRLVVVGSVPPEVARAAARGL